MSEFQFMSHSISPMRFFCNRQSGIKRHHNSDMETFASRFRNRRNHLGLSQKELAAKANVSQTTISDIERGRNDASRELLSLARALQVNPDWLQSGIGDMDNSLQAHLKASSTVTGKLTAYLLDGHAENFVRISAPSFEITATVAGAKQKLTLVAVANAATGEKLGATSQFEATADWLKSTAALEGTITALTIRSVRLPPFPPHARWNGRTTTRDGSA